MKQIEIHTNSKNKSVYIINPENMTVTGGVFGVNTFPLKSWNYENSLGSSLGKVKFELSDGRVVHTSSVNSENIIEKDITQEQTITPGPGMTLILPTAHSTYFVNIDNQTVVGGPLKNPVHYINDPIGLNMQINRDPNTLAFLAQRNIALGKVDECSNPGGAKFVLENGSVLNTSRIDTIECLDYSEQYQENDLEDFDFAH